MATTTADGILPELQREIDEFMASHAAALAAAASAASTRVEIASCTHLQPPLARLHWMATTIASTRFCETVQFLLSWLTTLEGRSQRGGAVLKSASWLAAYLVGEMLERLLAGETQQREGTAIVGKPSPCPSTAALHVSAAEKMVEQVLDRCVVVFQEAFQSDASRAVESGGGFFAFKPVVSHLRAPTAESTLQDSVACAWRHVIALVSLASLNPIRLRIQRQLLHGMLLAKPSSSAANSKDYLLLKNLHQLQLGLSVTSFVWATGPHQKVKDAAALLKMLLPLTLKPHKPPTRLAAITAIASILNRELDSLHAAELHRIHGSFHAVTEWTTCVSELHSVALKLSGKRDFAVAAWQMRVAVLSIAPTEIFNRYWKEDALALLRVQYQHNKDGGGGGAHAAAVLDCVGRCFLHMLLRHFLSDRRVPGELDCMEIINTTQAWCFFAYPKQRSLEKLNDHVVPVLVKISLGIASYNMQYAVQSHLRRLLLEADHIFDEKKLVGLESLLRLFDECAEDADTRDESAQPLDRKGLQANRITLAEVVGQTLIEANALFGGELLIESTTAAAAGSAVGVGSANPTIASAGKLLRDDYRRSLAIQSYACALRSLKYLYVALELSDDQKILILVRSCIHNEASIRESASVALHHIIQHETRQAGVVFRGITDYIFRLSNHLTTTRDFDAFLVLTDLVTSLLRSISVPDGAASPCNLAWESRAARHESLLQIESVAVYLLVFEDARLLNAAIRALEVVALSRSTTFGTSDGVAATVERPSVIDVIRKADWELRELLFSFESSSLTESLASQDVGFLRRLVDDLCGSPRASFRWSACLSVVFAQLAIWNPEVAAFMWSDVNDKVTKLEPVMASLLESEPSIASSFDLARWRNLAILATTTACPRLLFQPPRDEDVETTQDGESDGKGASVQSVISSSAVQALFKRLCRYLKSPSMEQKKAAILALGNTHISSLPILAEVLQKYEAEAFSPSIDQPSTSRHASLVDIRPPLGNGVNPAFGHTSGGGIGQRRFTKDQKIRNVKANAQLQLQWAVGRCYRLLLHTTQQRPLLMDDSTREAVHRLEVVALGVVDKMAHALSQLQQPATGWNACDLPHHTIFMMQQDFCSSVRSLSALVQASRSPYGSVRKRQLTPSSMDSISSRRSARRTSISSSKSASYRNSIKPPVEQDAVFSVKQRETSYALLLGWCHTFSSLANARLSSNLSGAFFAIESPARDHWMQRCDVFGERFEDTLLPWQWVDEGNATRALGIEEAAMASFQRFFVCQSVFATLSVVAHGPIFLPTPITPDSAVFRWLDECFAVDTGSNDDYSDGERTHHFHILQHFCHAVLCALLRSDFRSVADVCVDKSFFSVASGDKHNVAKHYFRAICSMGSELKRRFATAAVTKEGEASGATELPLCRSSGLAHNLEVRVCHAILLHLGIEKDALQRERAAQLMRELYGDDGDQEAAPFRLSMSVSIGKRSNAVFAAQVVNRMQVAGASFLVGKLVSLAYPMAMSILKFLSCCEPSQQKKMLVVVLPWLAEVSLVASPVISRGDTSLGASSRPALALDLDSDQLLSLLFRITTNLATNCSEQLEQAWLTVAFSGPRDAELVSQGESTRAETNLSRVFQFLFLQRATSVRLSTAKMVVWWLCRWQSAAHEVLREALLLVETRRRQSAEVCSAAEARSEPASAATIQPVDDVFVFVILMCDSCCHLDSIPSYMYQHPAMREAMMVQAVHFAFLALHALALDPKAFDVRRTTTSPNGGGGDDQQQQALYADARSDCLVLLGNLLGQLYAPVELLEQVVDELRVWSESWRAEDCESTKSKASSTISPSRNPSRLSLRRRSMMQFERAVASFAACLPSSLKTIWALECVKEITLALVPGSTLLQQTSSRCNNVQVLYCVRFGLLGYRVLAPEFHGDVFLSLLDLLHHSLDEHARDPAGASAVLRETLDTLRSMVACMPPRRLALYPQILWVCVALLNHAKQESLGFHTQIVLLLVEILKMPHFATNQLLQDVLLCKKPLQWTEDQASVLRTMVWNLDRGCTETQRLTLDVVAYFLTRPSGVFHANATEHLMICTMAMLPSLVACAAKYDPPRDRKRIDDDLEGESVDAFDSLAHDHTLWAVDATKQATDLQFAWLAIGSTPLSDAFAHMRVLLMTNQADTAASRALVEQFAAAFVPELLELAGEQAPSVVTMCFEILVKILATEDVDRRLAPLHSRADPAGDPVAATLWIVEALMHELKRRSFAWRPTTVLLGSLARLVRHRDQSQTWQAAIRIMNCLGASNRTTSATNAAACAMSMPPAKLSPQLTIAISSSAQPTDSATGRQHANATDQSGASTPGKKAATPSGARKFLNLMGNRSSSSSGTSPSHNQATNHHTPTSRTDSSRKKSSWAQDPSEDRSASPLSSRRDL